MLKSLSLPNTGMTVNVDIGEENDIHPKNKQEIGRRLSLWARATAYGEKLTWSGPLVVSGLGKQGSLAVRFQHADGGLAARDGELRGFELAGPDGKWRPAAAVIEGEAVVVRSAEVPDPIAVRYSWAAYPDGNLVNKAGLPASPFRLDIKP
jgi:sialate O-acetylesterase